MADLIRMDLYRLFRTKIFYIMLAIVTAACCVTKIISKLVSDFLVKLTSEDTENVFEGLSATADLSEILASPFAFSALFILVFVSLISFTYADISNGFIKNIAGQLPNKGYTVISKFAAIFVHNAVFIVCAAIGSIVGEVSCRTVVVDSQIGEGVLTFIAKLLLLQSLSTIILFVTTGLKNKTFASVLGVIISTGLLGIVYLGIETAAEKLLKLNDIKIAEYAPDQQLVKAGQVAFGNAVLVSVIVTAIFLTLTVKIFNRKDVK
ncbi:MAG: hypothetical protein II773_02920 [Oscillospiraceae bacterium]|nr:hypothetical protein [Oscillospiraceae bacterium]